MKSEVLAYFLIGQTFFEMSDNELQIVHIKILKQWAWVGLWLPQFYRFFGRNLCQSIST